MIIHESYVDLEVPGSGTMRAHVFKPNCEGKFGGVVVYSEIYQVCQVARLCAGCEMGGRHLGTANRVR